eukprot:GEMP01016412.1.p1 GENE.GEMP01016412.1~~GEMP01016412.1.p1  ORF type:complete len:832 (+),score=146.75 GEMP01016412.1:138-2633(+)
MGKGTKGTPPPVPKDAGKGRPPERKTPKPPSPRDEEIMKKLFDVHEAQFSLEDEDVKGKLGTYEGPTVKCARCQKDIRSGMWDTHWQAHSSEIESRLFLGGRRNVENIEELLLRTKITHVLDVAVEGGTLIQDLIGKVERTSMPLDDLPTQQLDGVVLQITAFMNKVLGNESNRLLVYCTQGISRSVTVVLAFLIQYRNLSLKDAFAMVKERRQIVDPRPEFIEFLGELEKKLHNIDAPTLLAAEVVGDRKKLDVDEAPKVPPESDMLDHVISLRHARGWRMKDMKTHFRFVDWDLQFSLVSKTQNEELEDLFATVACCEFLSMYGEDAVVPWLISVRSWIQEQFDALQLITRPLWFARVDRIWRNVFGTKRWQPPIAPSVVARKFSSIYDSPHWKPDSKWPIHKVQNVLGLVLRKAPFDRLEISSEEDAGRCAIGFMKWRGIDEEKWTEAKIACGISDDKEKDDAVHAFWTKVFADFKEGAKNFKTQKVDKKTCEKCHGIYTGDECRGCAKPRHSEVDPFLKWRRSPRRSIHQVAWDEMVQVKQIPSSSGRNSGVIFCMFEDGLLAVKPQQCSEMYAQLFFDSLSIAISHSRIINLYQDTEEYFQFFQALENISRDSEDPLTPMMMTTNLRRTNGFFGVIEVCSLQSLSDTFAVSVPLEPLLYAMGELAFGDSLVNNYDRFPLGKLWQNNGNMSNCVVTHDRVVGIDQAVHTIIETCPGFACYIDGLTSMFALDRTEFCAFVKDKLVTALWDQCGKELTDACLQSFTEGFFDARRRCQSVNWDSVFPGMESSVREIFHDSEVNVGQTQIPQCTSFLRQTIATIPLMEDVN